MTRVPRSSSAWAGFFANHVDVRQRQTEIQHRSAMQFDLHQFPDPSSPPIDEPPVGPDSIPVREPNPIPSPDVPVREPDPAEPNQI